MHLKNLSVAVLALITISTTDAMHFSDAPRPNSFTGNINRLPSITDGHDICYAYEGGSIAVDENDQGHTLFTFHSQPHCVGKRLRRISIDDPATLEGIWNNFFVFNKGYSHGVEEIVLYDMRADAISHTFHYVMGQPVFTPTTIHFYTPNKKPIDEAKCIAISTREAFEELKHQSEHYFQMAEKTVYDIEKDTLISEKNDSICFFMS